MLFDLQSPRRRLAVKFVYGGLAVLIGGGLILGTFGSSGGGLLDSIGLGGGGGGSDPFKDQISSAQAKVTANPKDRAALLELTRAHFLSGNSKLDADPQTGQTKPTEDSNQEFERAADAWTQYLKTKPTKPSSDVASLIVQAYIGLAQSATSASAADSDIKGAAAAQQIVADAMPSQGSLSNLAIYLYFSGDTAGGDKAAQQASALAQPAQKTALAQQLAQLKTQAAKFRQEVKAALKPPPAPGGAPAPGAPSTTNPFQNPLSTPGGLGG